MASVSSGAIINASDYNALVDSVIQVYGNPGYGQLLNVDKVISRTFTDTNFSGETDVDITNNEIDIVGHSFSNGDLVKYTPNGNLEITGEINTDSYYYVKVISVNAIQLTFDSGLSDVVQLDTVGSGTHTLKKVNAEDITATQYNNLLTIVNAVRQYQNGSNTSVVAVDATDIIGADTAYATSVGVGFGGSNAKSNSGLNDLDAAISLISTGLASGLVDPANLSGGDIDEPDNVSTRTQQWNGSIYHEFKVEFDGGYNTTAADGSTVEATGLDHRRHFFNAGGQIIIEASLTGSTAKDTDWGTMLGNMKRIYFGKNSTTTNGTGLVADGTDDVDGDGSIDPARGNDQMIQSYRLIAKKFGSDPLYAENYCQVSARRSSAGDILTFQVQFTDADDGDQQPGTDVGEDQFGNPYPDGAQLGPDTATPAGPGVDEPVMDDGGLMKSIVTCLTPTTYISVPKPSFPVSDVDISD